MLGGYLRTLSIKLNHYRCKDLESHNNQLLQHLDTVTSQATRIRQVANSSVPTTPGITEGSTEGETANDTLAELRSIMSYLRREKDIVDLQLEVSKQETSRQRAQIDHLSQSLDETRAALSEVSFGPTFSIRPTAFTGTRTCRKSCGYGRPTRRARRTYQSDERFA